MAGFLNTNQQAMIPTRSPTEEELPSLLAAKEQELLKKTGGNMPVQHAVVGGVHRVIESESGQPAMGEDGQPIDGGGFETADEALMAVSQINKALYGQEGPPNGAAAAAGPAAGGPGDVPPEALATMLQQMR